LILAGANVTATNVTFQQNRAQGGNGGDTEQVGDQTSGGGGGFSTNGKPGTHGFGGHDGLPGGGDGGNSKGVIFAAGSTVLGPVVLNRAVWNVR
jgi:hypothetical protein